MLRYDVFGYTGYAKLRNATLRDMTWRGWHAITKENMKNENTAKTTRHEDAAAHLDATTLRPTNVSGCELHFLSLVSSQRRANG